VVTKGDRLPVLFLWHHHQPFYQAPNSMRPLLPWIRLHAVRGYQDMLTAAAESEACVTFNFSPSLLEQLEWAAAQEICDEFERVSLVPAADLSEDDKKFLFAHFFSINWAVHVKPHARYAELLAKRGETLKPETLRRALVNFAAQDYCDLKVLFHLTWIGFAGRRDPLIAGLLRKGRGYSENDARDVLQFHHRLLNGIIASYRQLLEKGQIEISTSPFSHAILPLLCDSGVAAPDIPHLHLPRPDYRHPQDVEHQLKSAIRTHQRVWGVVPQGLWPAEGSVSDDVLAIAADTGFRWAVTDQGILERSERSTSGSTSHFRSYGWKAGEYGLRLFFRDHALSDAIGFRYAFMQPSDAVSDFVSHLERIEENTRAKTESCVVIALDGENPWESYPDGGEGFLTGIYTALRKHPRLCLSTFSEQMHMGVREHVHAVHPGSWIDANFRIWIGEPTKNQAWRELSRAREVLDEMNAGDPRRAACQHWLMRAQASDWFWWYGEPFSSDYKQHFDELFRAYLRAAYAAADRQPPPSLDVPISVPVRAERRVQPVFPIVPVINGRESSFYEWMGACRIDPRQYGTVMGRTEHSLRALYYGFGVQELFFRFDPASTLHPHADTRLTLHILGQQQVTVNVSLSENQVHEESEGYRLAYETCIELAVSFDRLSLTRGGECQFWMEICANGNLLEKLPPEGAYHFVVPTDEAMAANWVV
jgi:alpha-amylase/alpha-mannosidase (GH57 family)